MSPAQLPSSGFHYGVTFEDYQSWDAVNHSRLKPMAKSAAHCRYAMDNPSHSDEMDVGSALHIAILEPGRFEKEFYLGREEYNATTTAGKAVRAREIEEAAGRTYVRRKAGQNAVDADDIQGMAAAVWKYRTATHLLKMAGQCEVSALWQDPETGLMCKCRFDKLISADLKIIIELKTTRDAEQWSFGRDVAKIGYASQASYYQWGHKMITGGVPLHVVIAIENKPPYATAFYTLGDQDLQSGALNFRNWLNEYARCAKANDWPGYPDKVRELNMPRWAHEVEEAA